MSFKRGVVMKLAPVVAAIAIALAAGVPSAKADQVVYLLNQGNSALTPYAGPYVQVTVQLIDSTHATITVDSCGPDLGDVCSNPDYLSLIGGANAVGMNVNAASWTITSISGSNDEPGFTPGPWSNSGTWNGGGSFGSFNQTITSDDGFHHSSTQITFTLTNTGGTWASANDVFFANSNGNVVEAHAFLCVDTAQSDCTVAVITGYASTNGGNPVPEPASIALFGTGLMTLAGMIRKRRNQAK